jgi:hypothetical protein
MSELTLPALTMMDLTASSEQRDSRLIASFVGAADSRIMESIDTFLRALHRWAKEHAASEVIVDFRRLSFMNSSCFKAFVSWIGSLVDRPDAATYGIVLVYDTKQHWQQRSFGALVSLGGDRVTLASEISPA